MYYLAPESLAERAPRHHYLESLQVSAAKLLSHSPVVDGLEELQPGLAANLKEYIAGAYVPEIHSSISDSHGVTRLPVAEIPPDIEATASRSDRMPVIPLKPVKPRHVSVARRFLAMLNPTVSDLAPDQIISASEYERISLSTALSQRLTGRQKENLMDTLGIEKPELASLVDSLAGSGSTLHTLGHNFGSTSWAEHIVTDRHGLVAERPELGRYVILAGQAVHLAMLDTRQPDSVITLIHEATHYDSMQSVVALDEKDPSTIPAIEELAFAVESVVIAKGLSGAKHQAYREQHKATMDRLVAYYQDLRYTGTDAGSERGYYMAVRAGVESLVGVVPTSRQSRMLRRVGLMDKIRPGYFEWAIEELVPTVPAKAVIEPARTI